jgi:hypothetical protein
MEDVLKEVQVVKKSIESSKQELPSIIQQQLATLHISGVTPSLLSLSAFRKQVLEKSPSWNGTTAPWWDLTRFQIQGLINSTKLKHFCDGPPAKEQDEVKAFQPFLFENCKKLEEQSAKNEEDELVRSLAFIDTSQSPLLGSTRKPDISMFEHGKTIATAFNLVSIISIKRVMSEDGLSDLAAMLEDLLLNNPQRNSSQSQQSAAKLMIHIFSA